MRWRTWSDNSHFGGTNLGEICWTRRPTTCQIKSALDCAWNFMASHCRQRTVETQATYLVDTAITVGTHRLNGLALFTILMTN